MFARAKRLLEWWRNNRRNQIKHKIAELKYHVSSSRIAIDKMIDDRQNGKLIYPAVLEKEKNLLSKNNQKLLRLRHKHSDVLHAVMV
jgi:hypothetical protein